MCNGVNISDFDYQLPPELIAQFPAKSRDQSRLLIIERKTERLVHSTFKEIINFLHPGDALVLNDTKVKPVRLIGQIGNRSIAVLLAEKLEKNLYAVKAKPASWLKPGTVINFNGGRLKAICRQNNLTENRESRILEFNCSEDLEKIIEKIGLMPLPPYIKRPVEDLDKLRYQTVYAKNAGAIASPTAGLHFTEQILEQISQKKIRIVYLTLHVGLGTFSPIKTQDPAEHKMHKEYFNLPVQSAKLLEKVKSEGSKICAVGTTVCRVLESCAQKGKDKLQLQAKAGLTDLFICPPFEFKATDILLTNFHLPKTTLFLLVCAFAGKGLMRHVYEEAVKKRYRFYSYGDCMLII